VHTIVLFAYEKSPELKILLLVSLIFYEYMLGIQKVSAFASRLT
jgi:hypothetical protein